MGLRRGCLDFLDLAIFLGWVAVHSSYCSSNSSPPSYPLIRTPWAKTQVPAVHSQKSLVIASSGCSSPLTYGKLWFVHPFMVFRVGLPSSDHPWQKKNSLIKNFPIHMPTDGGFPTDFPLIRWPGVPLSPWSPPPTDPTGSWFSNCAPSHCAFWEPSASQGSNQQKDRKVPPK